jgi:LysM repeat protein
VENREKAKGDNLSQLLYFSTLSMGELLPYLEDMEPVEEGYLRRDLALSVLVSMHDLDIQSALKPSKNPLQIRYVEISSKEGKESFEVCLYPGITEEQFSLVQNYILTEKWPYTDLGLLKRLSEGNRDKDLKEAFVFTESFQAVQRLFRRSDYALSDDELLELVTQGGWLFLNDFAKSQQYEEDLSNAQRQKFLISALEYNSRSAADLLLCYEQEFVLKRFSDAQITHLLSLLSLESEDVGVERFLNLLAESTRGDKVLAAVNKKKKYTEPVAISEKEKKCYVVKEGDSLWKIAKEHEISLKDLLAANKLEKDNYIFPGKKLSIP